MTPPIIEFDGVSKRFGGVRALQGVSFAVPGGEVHALVGENGSGKSTLIRICGGVFPPDEGTVRFEGREVSFANPLASRAAGISVVHQEIPICPDLTAAQNVLLGHDLPKRGGLIDWGEVNRRAEAVFAQLGVDIRPSALAGDLPIAQRQLIAIAQALSHQAKLLILDEPTSALSKQEAERLFEIMRGLKARGMTIIYVSHRLEEVFGIADRISALRDGHYVGTVPRAEATPEEVVRMMVGREITHLFPKEEHATGDVLLSVRGLSVPGAFEDVSFDLHGGEVLGLVGLQGSGTSEVLRALAGQYPQLTGEICPARRADPARLGRRGDPPAHRLRSRRSPGRRTLRLDVGARERRAAPPLAAGRGPGLGAEPVARRGGARDGAALPDPGGVARRAGQQSLRRQPAEGRHRPLSVGRSRSSSCSTTRRAVSTSAPKRRCTRS